jgi:hypothetical protein
MKLWNPLSASLRGRVLHKHWRSCPTLYSQLPFWSQFLGGDHYIGYSRVSILGTLKRQIAGKLAEGDFCRAPFPLLSLGPLFYMWDYFILNACTYFESQLDDIAFMVRKPSGERKSKKWAPHRWTTEYVLRIIICIVFCMCKVTTLLCVVYLSTINPFYPTRVTYHVHPYNSWGKLIQKPRLTRLG